ncbi:MAG: hypothetical protein ABJH64_03700 [Algoriphagus sp.]|uniref:hypothetical protein n=1 Tax=Algoriphagus sp. TaxID=1872435 RepID=UPI003297ACEF
MFFEKVFPHGKQVIFVNLVESSAAYFVEYHLAVRIHAVEELVQKFLPTPISYADQSNTLSQTPDRLGNSYPKKITVSDQVDFANILNATEDFFLNKGFDWLNQMIDPVVLEKEFLFQSKRNKQDFNLVEAAFRATALSKLYNPEDYQVLRQAFLEKIHSQDFTPFTIASFLQFLNHLDNEKQVAA